MRTPMIVANWKMNKTTTKALEFVYTLISGWRQSSAEVVICPPNTALAAVAGALTHHNAVAGAQNVHAESSGAYTGEVSAEMLREAGARYCIVGHSERRTLFLETDEDVQKKTRAVLDAGLCAIVCVGETKQQREDGRTEAVLKQQTSRAVDSVRPGESDRIVLAYEPVWAIGTGSAATAEDAVDAAHIIRATLAEHGIEADAVRVLYGGSVGADNIHDFVSSGEVDGALIGGASLDANTFLAIVSRAYGESR